MGGRERGREKENGEGGKGRWKRGERKRTTGPMIQKYDLKIVHLKGNLSA